MWSSSKSAFNVRDGERAGQQKASTKSWRRNVARETMLQLRGNTNRWDLFFSCGSASFCGSPSVCMAAFPLWSHLLSARGLNSNCEWVRVSKDFCWELLPKTEKTARASRLGGGEARWVWATVKPWPSVDRTCPEMAATEPPGKMQELIWSRQPPAGNLNRWVSPATAACHRNLWVCQCWEHRGSSWHTLIIDYCMLSTIS